MSVWFAQGIVTVCQQHSRDSAKATHTLIPQVRVQRPVQLDEHARIEYSADDEGRNGNIVSDSTTLLVVVRG